MNCGCSVCKAWPLVEARAKREPGRTAQAIIAKFVGDAYCGKDAVKTLATCPTIVLAVRTRERLRLAERDEVEAAEAERKEARAG